MLMMARRPVALSWQNATCSCPSADRDGAGGVTCEGGAELAGDDMVTVVTPCDRTWSARFLRTFSLCRARGPNRWAVDSCKDEPVRTGVTSHFGHGDMATNRRSLYPAHASKWIYQIHASSEDP